MANVSSKIETFTMQPTMEPNRIGLVENRQLEKRSIQDQNPGDAHNYEQ